jgi:beta-lactam-binding protein with PASTA domain
MLGDSLRRRHGAESEEGGLEPIQEPSSGFVLRWWHGVGAALLVLVVSFGVGFLLSTHVLFPRPDTAGTGIAVPSLYGQDRTAAEAAVREAGLAVGDVAELESLEAEVGRVLAQAPLPGQQLPAGGAVSFAVSAGPPELTVPRVTGLGGASARTLLERAGFEVTLEEVEGTEPAGTVVGSEPEPGTARALPAVVNLRVSLGPPEDTLPAAGTSAPAGRPIDSVSAVGGGG